jgi:hypothetical protein
MLGALITICAAVRVYSELQSVRERGKKVEVVENGGGVCGAEL